MDCGARSKAPTGVMEGTSFGPRLLGVADEYFHANCTDAAIAQLLERVHGFKTSPHAVLNVREAWVLEEKFGWPCVKQRVICVCRPDSGLLAQPPMSCRTRSRA